MLPEGEDEAVHPADEAAQVENMDNDSNPDSVSIADSQTSSRDLYTLEEMNAFLDETFGKHIKILGLFSDVETFIKHVNSTENSWF